MPEQATFTKKAQYRIDEIVGNLPASQVKNSKEELCAQLNVSLSQLNRLIRGNSEPTGTHLKIMAEFFEVPVDDLYRDI